MLIDNLSPYMALISLYQRKNNEYHAHAQWSEAARIGGIPLAPRPRQRELDAFPPGSPAIDQIQVADCLPADEAGAVPTGYTEGVGQLPAKLS